MRSITLLTLLIVFNPFYSFGGKKGSKAVKANYYYSHYAYADAIPWLEKLIATGNSSLDVHIKLGDCYRLTGNMEAAAKSYAKATIVKKCTNITFLNYGLVLMKLMRYEDAEKNFRKYLEKNPNDQRVLDLIASCGTAMATLNDIPSGIAWPAPFNTDGSEFAPVLWKDKLVFASNMNYDKWKDPDKWSGDAFCGIYSIPLTGPGAYGEKINEVYGPKKFRIEYHTGPCSFTADGKEIYYTASKYNRKFAARRSALVKDTTVSLQIMIASGFNERRQAFKKLKPFQYNSYDYSVAHPAISPNGNILVFTSDMPHGSGRRDLYLCKKEGDSWSNPVNLGAEINTTGDEVFPWWGNDNTLFFSSDGHAGLGGLDIYKTKYNAASNTFSKPESLPFPINSPYDDITSAMAVDLKSGYLSSDRPGNRHGDNIYYYEKREIYLQLNVMDSITRQPLEGVSIALNTKKRRIDTVSANGHFFARLYPEADYTLRISKDRYQAKDVEFKTATTKEMDTIFKNINLFTPDPPKRDTVAVTQAVPEQVVIRNRNVMDSPGIHNFNVGETYEVGDFSYAYNKYELTKTHQKFLDTLVVQLKRHSTMVIEIHAHTDCRGSEASNLKLSTKRALGVVDYLAAHGIERKRVLYKGLGNTQPKVKCPDCNSCTEAQHSLNRIFEFQVLQL